MGQFFANLYNYIVNTIDSLGILGAMLGSVLIIFESIIPPLPLFVFITINFQVFGYLYGFLISWFCTILGCILSYWLVKKFLSNFVRQKIKNIDLLNRCLNYIENLSITKITVILAIPFTPAFMMNIAAGLAKMDFKKFLGAIVISKVFLIYFWGIVGTSLVESFEHPENLIIVLIMIILAYLISLIVQKVFKLN